MAINFKKTCCMRIGPRCDINCAKIVSLTGKDLPWVTDIRYLGMHAPFIELRMLFFGKIGRFASEEVVLKIIHSKCVLILLYGLEACPLNKADLNSLDFVINCFL